MRYCVQCTFEKYVCVGVERGVLSYASLGFVNISIGEELVSHYMSFCRRAAVRGRSTAAQTGRTHQTTTNWTDASNNDISTPVHK